MWTAITTFIQHLLMLWYHHKYSRLEDQIYCVRSAYYETRVSYPYSINVCYSITNVQIPKVSKYL